jgi:hypothetical protein
MLLPLSFLKFWFFTAPIGLVRYFLSFNSAFMQFLSLPLLLRTFFKPLKNEYRQGLVGFSIAMGVVVKSILILFDLFLFGCLLILELLVILGFLYIPLGTMRLLIL